MQSRNVPYVKHHRRASKLKDKIIHNLSLFASVGSLVLCGSTSVLISLVLCLWICLLLYLFFCLYLILFHIHTCHLHICVS